jgi:hypothetical protein
MCFKFWLLFLCSVYPIYPQSLFRTFYGTKREFHIYLVFGLCPFHGILESIKHNVSEVGSVSVVTWGGGTPILWDPLERTDLNHSFSFRNAVFSSFYNTGRWTKSENPAILSVIHHRQNSLESTPKWESVMSCDLPHRSCQYIHQ